MAVMLARGDGLGRASRSKGTSLNGRRHQANAVDMGQKRTLCAWIDVCFTPKSGQTRRRSACPLSADCVAKVESCRASDFFAKTRNGKQSPIRITSIALPKSPVSFARGDEVPHIFTRKPRLQPAEFLITGAKRLLQHNLPTSDIRTAAICGSIRSPRRRAQAEQAKSSSRGLDREDPFWALRRTQADGKQHVQLILRRRHDVWRQTHSHPAPFSRA